MFKLLKKAVKWYFDKYAELYKQGYINSCV